MITIRIQPGEEKEVTLQENENFGRNDFKNADNCELKNLGEGKYLWRNLSKDSVLEVHIETVE